MEHIDGPSLSGFCNNQERIDGSNSKKEQGLDAASLLTVKDRLRIILDVCHGIQRAHEVPLVHRDLKPGNILLTQKDSNSGPKYVPKIIDFGLSHPLDDCQYADHRWTRPGTPLGTLEYMSPEQARGLQDVDVRTDVYSIGVILYRLLTGSNPLQVRGLPLEDVLRTIRETDPVRPSAAVANADTEKIAPLLQSMNMPRKQQLSKALRGDLDKLVLKALRKNRDERFTLSELSADLDRYLNDYPVLAEPPSQIHRAALAYRRNPWACWLAVLAFLLLLAWLKTTHSAATLAQENTSIAEKQIDRERSAKIREKSLRELEQDARKKAEVATQEAIENAESLKRAIEIIESALETVDPRVSKVDHETAVPNLLGRIGTELNNKALGDTDAVLKLRMKAADILVEMCELDAAMPLLEGIVDSCSRRFGDHHENTDLARIHLGRTYVRGNQLQRAQDIFWEIFQRTKKSLGNDHYRTLSAALFVAETQRVGGHYSEAIFMLEQVIKRHRPDGTLGDQLSTQAHYRLGQIQFMQEDYDQATKAFQLVLKEFQSNANLPAEHPFVLEVRSDLAAVLEKQGRHEEAIKERRELLTATIRQYPEGSDPVARAKFNLAVSLSNAGQHAEALPLLQESSTSNSDTDIGMRSRYVTGQILEKQGNVAEAQKVLEHLLPRMKQELDVTNSLLINAQKLLDRLTQAIPPKK